MTKGLLLIWWNWLLKVVYFLVKISIKSFFSEGWFKNSIKSFWIFTVYSMTWFLILEIRKNDSFKILLYFGINLDHFVKNNALILLFCNNLFASRYLFLYLLFINSNVLLVNSSEFTFFLIVWLWEMFKLFELWFILWLVLWFKLFISLLLFSSFIIFELLLLLLLFSCCAFSSLFWFSSGFKTGPHKLTSN